MKKAFLFLLLCFLIGVCSCSKRTPPGRLHGESDYYTHTVKYPGESLSIIALWYSGSAQASSEILKHNLKLQGKALRVGSRVNIPTTLIKRKAPLPKGFVMETLSSKAKKARLQQSLPGPQPTPTASAQRAEQPSATTVITNSPESAARRRQVLQELLEE